MVNSPEVTFTGVLIYRKNHVFVSAVSDELSDKNIDHAVIFRWMDNQWARKTTDVSVRGMVALDGQKTSLLNMGTNGKVIEFTFPGERIECIDQSPDGPSELLHLRAIRQIGTSVFVAGMGRRVYRREAPNKWIAFDADMFASRADRKKSVGFNAIDGVATDNIFVVGYNGEIWHYDGANWAKEDSPVSVVLNAVRVTPNNDVYVSGMAGTIIKGRAGEWTVLSQDASAGDFWDMAIFHDRVYFSSHKGIYKLDENVLTKVGMGRKEGITTAYLDAKDGVLWSVGEKDLLYTSDGITWTTVQFG